MDWTPIAPLPHSGTPRSRYAPRCLSRPSSWSINGALIYGPRARPSSNRTEVLRAKEEPPTTLEQLWDPKSKSGTERCRWAPDFNWWVVQGLNLW